MRHEGRVQKSPLTTRPKHQLIETGLGRETTKGYVTVTLASGGGEGGGEGGEEECGPTFPETTSAALLAFLDLLSQSILKAA